MDYKFKYITGHVNVISKYNTTDFSGETNGGGTFRFKLKKTAEFRHMTGKLTNFTHIELVVGDCDYNNPRFVKRGSIVTAYINPIPTIMWREMYEALAIAETSTRQLDGWCFSDEIYKLAYPNKNRNVNHE